MKIQIGAKPDSGFDDPLGMLKDCHRRIEHFLGILCVVAERASSRSLTDEEAKAVDAALSYFRVGGERHTADEEESLFPRLLAAGGFAEFERLDGDHKRAAKLHDDVEAIYRNWIQAGLLSKDESSQLLIATQSMRELYQAHIEIEDSIVFPRAAQVLSAEAITAIGEELRARRL